MILITMHIWLGPGRNMSPGEAYTTITKEYYQGFVTNLPLGEAIKHINAYEKAYNDRYPLAINLSLISATTIDNLTDKEIDIARVYHVEKLALTSDMEGKAIEGDKP